MNFCKTQPQLQRTTTLLRTTRSPLTPATRFTASGQIRGRYGITADAAPRYAKERSVSLHAADSRWRFAGSGQQGSFESLVMGKGSARLLDFTRWRPPDVLLL